MAKHESDDLFEDYDDIDLDSVDDKDEYNLSDYE